MQIRKLTQKKIGDCEVKAEHTNVEVSLQDGNIWMCDICRDYEEELTRRNEATRKLEQAAKIDAEIELKQDLFKAGTIPFVELQAAIDHDDSIPQERKPYVLAERCEERIRHLTQVIFDEESALTLKKNERAAFQVNLQTLVSRLKLSEKEQEKYKQYEINYKPQTPKSISKATKDKTPSKPFDKVAVYAAAKKYGVPAHEVQMRVVAGSNKTPERAAEYILEQAAVKAEVDPAAVKAVVLSRKITAEEAINILIELTKN